MKTIWSFPLNLWGSIGWRSFEFQAPDKTSTVWGVPTEHRKKFRIHVDTGTCQQGHCRPTPMVKEGCAQLAMAWHVAKRLDDCFAREISQASTVAPAKVSLTESTAFSISHAFSGARHHCSKLPGLPQRSSRLDHPGTAISQAPEEFSFTRTWRPLWVMILSSPVIGKKTSAGGGGKGFALAGATPQKHHCMHQNMAFTTGDSPGGWKQLSMRRSETSIAMHSPMHFPAWMINPTHFCFSNLAFS